MDINMANTFRFEDEFMDLLPSEEAYEDVSQEWPDPRYIESNGHEDNAANPRISTSNGSTRQVQGPRGFITVGHATLPRIWIASQPGMYRSEEERLTPRSSQNLELPWTGQVVFRQLSSNGSAESSDHTLHKQPFYMSNRNMHDHGHSDYATMSQPDNQVPLYSNDFPNPATLVRNDTNRPPSIRSAPGHTNAAQNQIHPIYGTRYARTEAQSIQEAVDTPSTPSSSLSSMLFAVDYSVSPSSTRTIGRNIATESLVSQTGAGFFDPLCGQSNHSIDGYPDAVADEHLTEDDGQDSVHNANEGSPPRRLSRRECDYFGPLSNLNVREVGKVQLKIRFFFDHDTSTWRCIFCPFQTTRANDAADHADDEILSELFMRALNGRYICTLGHKRGHRSRTLDKRSAIRHWMEAHSGQKPYGCDFCRSEFAKQHNLGRHLEKKHPTDYRGQNASNG